MKNKSIPVPKPEKTLQHMPDKVKMAKIASIISAIYLFLNVIILPLVFYFFYILFATTGPETNNIAIFIVVFCLVISLFIYIIPGTLFIFVLRGIEKRKKWAKTMGIVLSVIEIIFGGIFGKILGVLTIIGLSDEESKNWFIH